MRGVAFRPEIGVNRRGKEPGQAAAPRFIDIKFNTSFKIVPAIQGAKLADFGICQKAGGWGAESVMLFSCGEAGAGLSAGEQERVESGP